ASPGMNLVVIGAVPPSPNDDYRDHNPGCPAKSGRGGRRAHRPPRGRGGPAERVSKLVLAAARRPWAQNLAILAGSALSPFPPERRRGWPGAFPESPRATCYSPHMAPRSRTRVRRGRADL